MTASVRFKNVQNTNNPAAILTAAQVPSGDGDDRSFRLIKRVLVAVDVGTTAGKTRYAGDADNIGGCIVDVLPASYGPGTGGANAIGVNTLLLKGATYRPIAAQNGIPIAYRRIDNLTLNAGAEIANLQYFFSTLDNTIRVYDAGNNASVYLAAGDIVVVEYTFGPNQS